MFSLASGPEKCSTFQKIQAKDLIFKNMCKFKLQKILLLFIHLFSNINFTKITISDNVQLGLWPKKMFHLSKNSS